MTHHDSSWKEPLAVLRTTPVSVPSDRELAEERDALLPWLEARVARLPDERARHRRVRRQLRIGGGVLAAAAVAALFVGLRGLGDKADSTALRPPGFATLLSGRVEAGGLDLLPGSRLGLSSRLRTGDEHRATVRASSGYDVTLSEATEIAFLPEQVDAGFERMGLRLERGEVSLSVSKLGSKRSLAVFTPDATVRVTGTRFRVRLQGEGAERHTCVEVEEGRVVVERQARPPEALGVGQRSGCDSVRAAESLADPEGREALPARSAEPEASSAAGAYRVATGVQSQAGTSLQKQNELLAAALAAERQGQSGRAKQRFGELLRRFPDSPFAPEARAGLARLEERGKVP